MSIGSSCTIVVDGDREGNGRIAHATGTAMLVGNQTKVTVTLDLRHVRWEIILLNSSQDRVLSFQGIYLASSSKSNLPNRNGFETGDSVPRKDTG